MTDEKNPPSAAPATGRENCFDALRLVLAGLVIYSHSYALGGFGEEGLSRWARGQAIAGSLGVLGFFGLSGFLIAESFIRSPDAFQFLRRRVLRIMPGFWGCLIVTAVIIAPAMHWLLHGGLAGYPWWGEGSALNYVTHNAALRVNQWSVGDVLAGAAYPGSLNGSLWSLFPEFCCYLGLLAAGLCGLLRDGRAWLLAFTGVLLALHVVHASGSTVAPHTLPTVFTLTPLAPFIVAFFVGASCRAFSGRLAFGLGGAIFLGGVALVLLRLGGFRVAAPLLVPLCLLNLGHAFTLRLRHDFSYGAYIYAFPCQQLLALVPGMRRSVVVYFAGSMLLTLIFAAASWFFIERRFLPASRR
jgi:peptidoglycan/LPS O-acetylase OafA/YrhL